MESSALPQPRQEAGKVSGLADADQRAAILSELQSILSSQFFRASKRSKQFLSYVVHYSLEGHDEPLKERTIGKELFLRPANYATGDDPVVRVQAGEVRRRLEQYYHANPSVSAVRIELPVGAYAADFKWRQGTQLRLEPVALEEPQDQQPEPTIVDTKAKGDSKTRRFAGWAAVLSWSGLALVATLIASSLFSANTFKSGLSQFWSPVFATSEPVLICLAKPVVYRPSPGLYQRHSRSSSQFDTEFERLSRPPSLEPGEQLTWSDMVEDGDYGVARGDVYAAVGLSSLLGRMGKESRVRVGKDYSFEDLRTFPAIMLGGFSNRWTMQMTSNLHFAFVEENGRQMIREQGPPGRVWFTKYSSLDEVAEDYGVVTRLLNSKTGQFVVAAAGILGAGTQAAGEVISNQEYLADALRTAPPDWRRKNLQILVHTTVTDSVPGPPQVVAVYFW